MTKEGFNWKSIFVNDESSSNNTEKQVTQIPTSVQSPIRDNKFPETNMVTSSVPMGSSENPFLNEILEVYNKGFEGLNSEGFDFFEMYKSVMAVGPTNPQSYQMAFTMGKTIKSDLSKELLLEKSKFYISEIEKVYAKYDATGNSKNKDLNNTITTQKYNLSKNIADLETQIAKLQAELEAKKAELARIDFDNKEMFTQIQLKIDANNIAKHKILESINTVVTGINQYL
ncbi:hypothetical protein [Flavobacterium sp.]|uniref:hypothetical protein n=1 Tax=Flavobacterium sp. TaxID=239 RepID=UPI00286DD325|nr:hypothetical protein [Flavobacterium sp.]